MTHRTPWTPTAFFGIAVLATLAVGGCAAEAPPYDDAAAAAWADDVSAAAGDDAVAVLGGSVGPDAPASEPGEGIIAELPAPQDVDAIELSCYGEGTVTFGGQFTSDGIMGIEELAVVECADGTVTLSESVFTAAPLTAITINAYAADRQTRWVAVILGG